MEKIKNYVETVLQPKLQGDGGWVELSVLTVMSLLSFLGASVQNALS